MCLSSSLKVHNLFGNHFYLVLLDNNYKSKQKIYLQIHIFIDNSIININHCD